MKAGTKNVRVRTFWEKTELTEGAHINGKGYIPYCEDRSLSSSWKALRLAYCTRLFVPGVARAIPGWLLSSWHGVRFAFLCGGL